MPRWQQTTNDPAERGGRATPRRTLVPVVPAPRTTLLAPGPRAARARRIAAREIAESDRRVKTARAGALVSRPVMATGRRTGLVMVSGSRTVVARVSGSLSLRATVSGSRMAPAMVSASPSHRAMVSASGSRRGAMSAPHARRAMATARRGPSGKEGVRRRVLTTEPGGGPIVVAVLPGPAESAAGSVRRVPLSGGRRGRVRRTTGAANAVRRFLPRSPGVISTAPRVTS